MTMIEKMAKAIMKSELDRGFGEPGLDWGDYTQEAKAVLEAMLEPTDGMTQHETYTSGQWSRRNYAAMIRAALEEEL